MEPTAAYRNRVILFVSGLIALVWLALIVAAVGQWGLLRGIVAGIWGTSVPSIVVMIGLAARAPGSSSPPATPVAPEAARVQVAA